MHGHYTKHLLKLMPTYPRRWHLVPRLKFSLSLQIPPRPRVKDVNGSKAPIREARRRVARPKRGKNHRSGQRNVAKQQPTRMPRIQLLRKTQNHRMMRGTTTTTTKRRKMMRGTTTTTMKRRKMTRRKTRTRRKTGKTRMRTTRTTRMSFYRQPTDAARKTRRWIQSVGKAGRHLSRLPSMSQRLPHQIPRCSFIHRHLLQPLLRLSLPWDPHHHRPLLPYAVIHHWEGLTFNLTMLLL